MKLGSLKDGGRDGTLFVADKAVKKAITVPHIAATLQEALEDWSAAEEPLRKVSASLNAGQVEGSFAIDSDALASPLPRAYQFLDGSAYLAHVERVRKARGAEMPASFLTDPLMYQAVSASCKVAVMLDTRDALEVTSDAESVEWTGYVDSWKESTSGKRKAESGK